MKSSAELAGLIVRGAESEVARDGRVAAEVRPGRIDIRDHRALIDAPEYVVAGDRCSDAEGPSRRTSYGIALVRRRGPRLERAARCRPPVGRRSRNPTGEPGAGHRRGGADQGEPADGGKQQIEVVDRTGGEPRKAVSTRFVTPQEPSGRQPRRHSARPRRRRRAEHAPAKGRSADRLGDLQPGVSYFRVPRTTPCATAPSR